MHGKCVLTEGVYTAVSLSKTLLLCVWMNGNRVKTQLGEHYKYMTSAGSS